MHTNSIEAGARCISERPLTAHKCSAVKLSQNKNYCHCKTKKKLWQKEKIFEILSHDKVYIPTSKPNAIPL